MDKVFFVYDENKKSSIVVCDAATGNIYRPNWIMSEWLWGKQTEEEKRSLKAVGPFKANAFAYIGRLLDFEWQHQLNRLVCARHRDIALAAKSRFDSNPQTCFTEPEFEKPKRQSAPKLPVHQLVVDSFRARRPGQNSSPLTAALFRAMALRKLHR